MTFLLKILLHMYKYCLGFRPCHHVTFLFFHVKRPSLASETVNLHWQKSYIKFISQIKVPYCVDICWICYSIGTYINLLFWNCLHIIEIYNQKQRINAECPSKRDYKKSTWSTCSQEHFIAFYVIFMEISLNSYDINNIFMWF